VRQWDNARADVIPFLDYDLEIRRVRVNHERDRKPQRPLLRGGQGPAANSHPRERAALKCMYLVTRSLDPTGNGRARWTSMHRGQRQNVSKLRWWRGVVSGPG
jgi:putative transposase